MLLWGLTRGAKQLRTHCFCGLLCILHRAKWNKRIDIASTLGRSARSSEIPDGDVNSVINRKNGAEIYGGGKRRIQLTKPIT